MPAGLIAALRNQRQIDKDGSEVAVSRQAVDEAADLLDKLATPPADGRAQQDADKVDAQPDDADDQWRRLALQFDAHRMQALGTLRAVAKALANGGLYDDLRNSIEAFLAAPPLPGEQALADLIAAMATLHDPAMAGDDRAAFESWHATYGIEDGKAQAWDAWQAARKRVQPASGEDAN